MRSASIDDVVAKIVAARHQTPTARGVLVAVSGIDGSGKGYVTGKIVETLRAKGLRVAEINIDGWLNLPHIRFTKEHPAEHFYRHAIRFDAYDADFCAQARAAGKRHATQDRGRGGRNDDVGQARGRCRRQAVAQERA